MTDPIEILKALREKKVRQLEDWQAQVGDLQANIQGVTCQIAGIDESIKALSAATERTDTGTLPLLKTYDDMPLTPAVLSVIQNADIGPGLLVPEIIQKLTAEGFKSNAESLYASVYSVAMRLVKQDKIKETKKSGKRAFVRKEPF